MKLGTYKGICLKVYEIIEPIVSELGYRIWDVEYYKEGSEQILCVTIDSEEGIDILDCEKVSRAIDEPLDVHDPIPVEYFLQVSSPGVERELKRAEHFEEYVGEKVTVGFYSTPKEGVFKGKKNAVATLKGFDEEETMLSLETNEGEESVPLEKLTGVKCYFEF